MNLPERLPPNVAPIIAIDGPAGAGKSSVAIRLAAALAVPYLDTGAMYRAVGLMALQAGIRPPLDAVTDGPKVAHVAAGRLRLAPGPERMRVWIDGVEVTDEIRSPECSEMASAVSALPEVRRALVPEQRQMGLLKGGVMEGRDIGSVVFPDAMLKIFLTASVEIRARRRYEELAKRGLDVTFENVLADQAERDFRDTNRVDSPLQVASGAIVVDTSGLSLESVVARLVALFGDLQAVDFGPPMNDSEAK